MFSVFWWKYSNHLTQYLGEWTVMKEVHSTNNHVVFYLLRHFLVKPREQIRLQHDGDLQSQAKQETGVLQPLCRPAYHQGPTWGVRQGEEILTEGWERGGTSEVNTQEFCDEVCLYKDSCFKAHVETESNVWVLAHLVRQYSLSPGMPRNWALSPVAMTRVSAVRRLFLPFMSVTWLNNNNKKTQLTLLLKLSCLGLWLPSVAFEHKK